MSTTEQEPIDTEVAVGETTQAPVPTPEPAAAKQTTDYLVLSKDADKDWWIKVGVYTAPSSKAAVAAAVKATNATVGTFVAVPMRSWQPLSLTIDTQTKIKLT